MVFLELYHGRNDPTLTADDLGGFGETGPLFGPFEHIQFTYHSHVRPMIPTPAQAMEFYASHGESVSAEDKHWKEATAQLRTLWQRTGQDLFFWYYEDMIYYDGMWYGDWSIHGFDDIMANRPGETPLYPELDKMSWPEKHVPIELYKLSRQELATALVCFGQTTGKTRIHDISENYADHFHDTKPLNMEDIDRLCERLNTDDSSRPVEKDYKVSVVKTVTSRVDCNIKATSAEEAEKQALITHGSVVSDNPDTQISAQATEVAR